jgi:hypothetical protein
MSKSNKITWDQLSIVIVGTQKSLSKVKEEIDLAVLNDGNKDSIKLLLKQAKALKTLGKFLKRCTEEYGIEKFIKNSPARTLPSDIPLENLDEDKTEEGTEWCPECNANHNPNDSCDLGEEDSSTDDDDEEEEEEE